MRIHLSKLIGFGIAAHTTDVFEITFDHRGFLPVSWKAVPAGTAGAVSLWELLQIISDASQE